MRHELGSLGLGAEDAQAAEADLERARELREQRGDGTGLRATEHNLETLRLAFTGGGGGGRWSTRTLAIAGATVLALVISASCSRRRSTTAPTTTSPRRHRPRRRGRRPPPPPPPSPPPSDAVAPRVQITAPPDGVVVRSAEVAITGTAGDAPGDATTVQLIIRAGSSDGEEVLGPIDVARQGTDWSHTATLPLKAGTRMQYTAEATQRDEAGNTSQPETVTFTAYRPPPPPPTVTDPPPTVTAPADRHRATATRARRPGLTGLRHRAAPARQLAALDRRVRLRRVGKREAVDLRDRQQAAADELGEQLAFAAAEGQRDLAALGEEARPRPAVVELDDLRIERVDEPGAVDAQLVGVDLPFGTRTVTDQIPLGSPRKRA